MTVHCGLRIPCRPIGNYALILWKIINHDLIPFLVVFAVVLFAFTGGLFLERRLELDNAHHNNTGTDMNTTSEFNSESQNM